MKRRQILGALLAFAMTAAQAHGDKHAPAASYPAEQKDWGIAGEQHAATRTIDIDMTDSMRFTPEKLTLREGETVRFAVHNKGRMLHEMVIGTAQELNEHAALMAKYPNMEHSEPYMVHVAPGKNGEITWNFNRAGEFEFACLVAGHYEAGMRGTITVTPSKQPSKQ